MKTLRFAMTAMSMGFFLNHGTVFAAAAAPVSSENITTSGKGHNIFANPIVKDESLSLLINADLGRLTKSESNLQLSFLKGEYLAMDLVFASSSSSELGRKVATHPLEKVTVERSYMGIGSTGYLFGTKANKNVYASLAFLFGQERDKRDVANQSGIGFRVAGQIRPFNKFSLDAGIAGNNLSGSFYSEGFFGFGILL